MDATIDFLFRRKLYKAEVLFDNSESPCLVFVIVDDEALIQEFADVITLKTDFYTLLPKKDDYPELIALRNAIFAIVKNTSFFLAGREIWQKEREKNKVNVHINSIL